MWEESIPPPSTPADDAWDAFGGSRETSKTKASFTDNCEQVNQPTSASSRHNSNVHINIEGSLQSDFQPNFDNANFDQILRDRQKEGQVIAHAQNNSVNSLKQSPQHDSNGATPQDLFQQPSSVQQEPSFQANFTTAHSTIQKQSQVQPPQFPSQSIISDSANKQPQPNQGEHVQALSSGHHHPQRTVSHLQQPNFNTKFSDLTYGNQQVQAINFSGVSSERIQQPPPFLQSNFNAKFSNAQFDNQQQQQPQETMVPPQKPSSTVNFSKVVPEYVQNQPQTLGEQPTQQPSKKLTRQAINPQQQPQNTNPYIRSSFTEIFPGALADNQLLQHPLQPQSPPSLPTSDINVHREVEALGTKQQAQTNTQQLSVGTESNLQHCNLAQTDNNGDSQRAVSSAMNTNEKAQNAFDAFDALSFDPRNYVNPLNKIENNEKLRATEKVLSPSKYSVGQIVTYKDRNDNLLDVEIIKIHTDDNLVPFYTVRMPDGREKQTDDIQFVAPDQMVELHVDATSPQESANDLPFSANTNAQKPLGVLDHCSQVEQVANMLRKLSGNQLAAVEQFIVNISNESQKIDTQR